MAFDLSNYMTAEERIELFAKDNPDFRYEINHEFYKDSNGDTWVVVKAILWRTEVDPNAWVMGLAAENMKTQFAIEKAETSAYARAITNTGKPQFSTTKNGEKAPRANRAEMERVNNVTEFKPKYGTVGSKSAAMEAALNLVEQRSQDSNESTKTASWSIGEVIPQIGEVVDFHFTCNHGDMVKKQGVAAKTGRPYFGFVCPAPKAEACEAKWASVAANGSWFFDDKE